MSRQRKSSHLLGTAEVPQGQELAAQALEPSLLRPVVCIGRKPESELEAGEPGAPVWDVAS